MPAPPRGRVVVIGAGKGAAQLGAAFERLWAETTDAPLSGVIVTRYGYQVPCRRIEIVEAAHPVPDANGVAAAKAIFQQVQGLSANDLVLCLISGGGSALFTWPPAGVSLADLAAINRQLLACGATIGEMNTVRKNLSRSSGGRLAAAAYPAPVVSLIISDVPGDNLEAIASGPTVGDTASASAALAILEAYNLAIPPAVRDHLQRDPDPVIAPTDPRLSRTDNRLIATPQRSLEAAATLAQSLGYAPLILGNALEGEAADVGTVHGGMAKQVVGYGQPLPRPCVLLSGGETTVTLRGKGRGGRNSAFLLGLALALDGLPGTYAIACDTDGIDGSETNAGAILTPDTLTRAQAQGLSAAEYQANSDSYSFFAALDQLVETGPTLTNVNDFRAVLIEAD